MNRDTRMDAVEEVISLSEGNKELDRLAKSDYGPFLLLFFLFLAGFVMCTGGILLFVLGGRLSIALFVIFPIVGIVVEARERWTLKKHRGDSRVRICNETEKWVIVLGWCLPRKHREAILGDILEDYQEMKERGLSERNIRIHVLWQWLVSVVLLIPSAIIAAVCRIVSPTK